MMFPIWTIVLIAILIIIVIILTIYLVKRRRARSLSVHTIHERDEEELREKKSISTGSVQTLVTQKQSSTPLPLSTIKITPQTTASSESTYDKVPPEPPQEIKISLPLPPPTTSLFSDKMELEDGAQDLFDAYLTKKKKEEGFLHQKAATIRSTLRQSLRPKQNNSNNRNSIMDLFPAEPTITFTAEPTITFTAEPTITFTAVKEEEEEEKKINPKPQVTTNIADHVVTIDDESPITPNEDLQEPVRAAKRALRSASRKTKTRSVVEDKHGSVRFNSIRLKGEHLTLTSGSMRRFMRENVVNDEELLASTRKTNRKNDTSAVEIASWWGDQQQENLPQYRASLSTSIFTGTLSRTSGSSASLFPDKEGTVSRHGSFRRGTLGKNTLKSITTATSGVNRSLKGLFDHASTTSSNKIVPDDSQKMELDDAPPVSVAEEKLAVGQHGVYALDKSVRNTTVSRPGLPTSFVQTSESSTKYALSDEEDAKEEDMYKRIESTSPTSTTSPVTVVSDHTATQPGEVDAIRRVLQDTWVRESPSSYSMLSEDSGSIAPKTTIPRQQQSLLTRSLLSQQAAKRASLRLSMHEDDFPIQGPEPSASFSSSTVRTMIPDQQASEPIAVRKNAIQRHGSTKIQESSYESSHLMRFSTSPMTDMGSPRHSSADSSRGHSRKSSGGNSTATALRISSGYAANAKTWNGRKSGQRPALVKEMQQDTSISKNSNRAFFSTMRKGQKSRGNIPWMQEDEDQGRKTPAQKERDRYLEGKP